jgi:hypothetical protein
MALRKIGTVGVDSGRIRIGDPCYLVENPSLCIEISQGGDGNYPVFELGIDGRKFLAVEMIHFDAIYPRPIEVHVPMRHETLIHEME